MPGVEGERETTPQRTLNDEAPTDSQQQRRAVDEVVHSQPFEPLFTLLANATTNTTIHPRIHYLFSDDDPSVLNHVSAADDRTHRAIVVDLAETSANDSNRWSVSWASSVSPEFAITSSQIALQQSEGDQEAEGGALMLRLEGVEREPVDVNPDSLPASSSGSLGREDVEGMADDFRRRMGVLKKIVGEGERRREAVAQQEPTNHPDAFEAEGIREAQRKETE